ncbi:MAG: HupE/UreJ family protein [Burkholderiaceae bacterium]
MKTLLAVVLFTVTTFAAAHGNSTAYLTLLPAGNGTHDANYRLALRDADALLDLDANGDGVLTWGEVDDRGADLRALVQRHLTFTADGRPCTGEFSGPTFARDADVGFVAFSARLACAQPLQLGYTLFDGIDATHRVAVQSSGQAPRLLAPASVTEFASSDAVADLGGLLAQGVTHILGGLDHLLFLIALLLPAVLVREAGRWRAASALRPALVQVAWIATAFTAAHSITLALASFGVLRVPASVVEPLIALTVLLAALNNLWPVVQRHLALVAFAFGLVHGFGFAEVLAPLGLPPGELAWALLAFNLGVELGQVSVVGAAFVLLALLRRWSGYPRWVLGGGSAAVALLAVGWIVERVLDVPVFGLLAFTAA